MTWVKSISVLAIVALVLFLLAHKLLGFDPIKSAIFVFWWAVGLSLRLTAKPLRKVANCTPPTPDTEEFQGVLSFLSSYFKVHWRKIFYICTPIAFTLAFYFGHEISDNWVSSIANSIAVLVFGGIALIAGAAILLAFLLYLSTIIIPFIVNPFLCLADLFCSLISDLGHRRKWFDRIEKLDFMIGKVLTLWEFNYPCREWDFYIEETHTDAAAP